MQIATFPGWFQAVVQPRLEMIRIRLQDMFVRWVETPITSTLAPPCEIFAQAHDKWDELLSLHGDQLVERLHIFCNMNTYTNTMLIFHPRYKNHSDRLIFRDNCNNPQPLAHWAFSGAPPCWQRPGDLPSRPRRDQCPAGALGLRGHGGRRVRCRCCSVGSQELRNPWSTWRCRCWNNSFLGC